MRLKHGILLLLHKVLVDFVSFPKSHPIILHSDDQNQRFTYIEFEKEARVLRTSALIVGAVRQVVTKSTLAQVATLKNQISAFSQEEQWSRKTPTWQKSKGQEQE